MLRTVEFSASRLGFRSPRYVLGPGHRMIFLGVPERCLDLRNLALRFFQ